MSDGSRRTPAATPSALVGGRGPASGVRTRQRGAALPLVLACVVVVGLAGLSLTFVATLDTLAAAHAQDAARAAGQADAGLALAAAGLTGASGGATSQLGTLGPWPSAGVDASVEVVFLQAGVVELTSSALVGRSRARRRLVVDMAGGVPVVLSRP